MTARLLQMYVRHIRDNRLDIDPRTGLLMNHGVFKIDSYIKAAYGRSPNWEIKYSLDGRGTHSKLSLLTNYLETKT